MNTSNTKNADIGASFTTSILPLLHNALWALKRTWSTHALLTAGVIVVTLMQSIIPASLVLIARGRINTVASGLSGGDQSITSLLPWLILGLALSLTEAISRNANKLFTQRLYDELNLKITSEILTHATSLDVCFFEDPRFQDILQRARQNTATHFSQFVTNILATVTNIIQLSSLVLILIVIEPLISLILVLLGFPYLVFQWKFARMRYKRQHSRTTKYRWTSYFVSLLTSQHSIAEVKLFNLGSLLIKKFRTLITEFRDQDRALYMRSFVGSAVFYLISTTAFYLTFAWIAFMALRGELTIGDVAVYGGITMRLSLALENTILSATQALEHTLYVSNMIEFLKLTPHISTGSGLTPVSAHGAIELRNISFTYPGSLKPTLSDISLNIRPGEAVALVGENGAGKTTLVKLIARLYDPDKGEILFDGVELKQLSLPYLHSQISFVFQEFGRYEASVADNIAYGDWRSLLEDREKIERIARRAEVHPMIEQLPQGYETLLGRMFGEYTLSGGQWQQLALARAFAREAKLLILDEPTSNLDARTEYNIFCRFRELAKGRTTILISHRFSTVSMAERIFVMNAGQIVEQGSHQKLLDINGQYAALYRLHRAQMMDSDQAEA